MRKTTLAALVALPVLPLLASAVACSSTPLAELDGGATTGGGAAGDASCTTPAPGCYCVPAWWTTDTCYAGPRGTKGIGRCKAGKMTCSNDGVLSECAGQVLPEVETCNGIDDDCNGVVDDVPELADGGAIAVDASMFEVDGSPEGGPLLPAIVTAQPITCMTGLPSYCGYGHRECSNGKAACVPNAQYGLPETCNDIDDDCDGIIDNHLDNLPGCSVHPSSTSGTSSGQAFSRTVMPLASNARR